MRPPRAPPIFDGTIAIARAHNFTVDWIDGAGRTSTPRIPYEWKRLSNGEKAAIVDSIRARRSESPLMVRLSTGETVPSPERVLGIEAVPDYLPPFGGGGYSESDAHVLGDGDGRLWVRVAVNTSVVPRARGEPPPAAIYSVISRAEGLVDRIRVPEGAAIVGFGRGVAYVATHDAGAVKLERVRIRQ